MICPYCRGEIQPGDAGALVCEGCSTPHHTECFEENGGCTLFGCQFAPPDEPKVSVASQDFQQAPAQITLIPAPFGAAGAMVAQEPIALATAPPPPIAPSPLPAGTAAAVFASQDVAANAADVVPSSSSQLLSFSNPYKSRMTYIMLALFLGSLGAHNFYAGYKLRAILQLCISFLTLGYGAIAVWIWAVVEACTTEHDGLGRELT